MMYYNVFYVPKRIIIIVKIKITKERLGWMMNGERCCSHHTTSALSARLAQL